MEQHVIAPHVKASSESFYVRPPGCRIATMIMVGAISFSICGCKGCHSIDPIGDDARVVGTYNVARGNWSSRLVLRADHTSHQELAEAGKPIKVADGTWSVRSDEGEDWVALTSEISLRDNPRDYPRGLTNWGELVGDNLAIQHNPFSNAVDGLSIDEEEDGLSFDKQ